MVNFFEPNEEFGILGTFSVSPNPTEDDTIYLPEDYPEEYEEAIQDYFDWNVLLNMPFHKINLSELTKTNASNRMWINYGSIFFAYDEENDKNYIGDIIFENDIDNRVPRDIPRPVFVINGELTDNNKIVKTSLTGERRMKHINTIKVYGCDWFKELNIDLDEQMYYNVKFNRRNHLSITINLYPNTIMTYQEAEDDDLVVELNTEIDVKYISIEYAKLMALQTARVINDVNKKGITSRPIDKDVEEHIKSYFKPTGGKKTKQKNKKTRRTRRRKYRKY